MKIDVQKRLLIAVDTYYPKTDGVIRYLSYVVPKLKKFFEIKIVAPKYSKKKYFGVEESLVYTLPLSIMGYSPTVPSISLFRKIMNSDILFVQDLATIGIQTIIGGKILKKPIALFCHHDEALMISSILKNKLIARKIGEEIIKKAVDTIVSKLYGGIRIFFVATEKFYRKLRRVGIPKDKIVFNPFSVDTGKFKPRNKEECRKILGLPSDKKIVLYVGRISPEKNVETLLKAAENLKEYLFVIIGKGPKLEEYRKKYKLRNIIFIGYQPDDILPIIYSSADVFVHPSLHESQSFTTLEAMASGLPIIVTKDYEGEYSYYKNGKNVIFLEDPLNHRELSEKILFVLENPEVAEKLGREARKTVLKYSWEKHVRILKEEFEKILNAGAGI